MQELKQGSPLQGGKYIVKRVLGQGGFGITYLAEQVSLGREVAIKEFFMKDSCVRDESSSEVSLPTNGSAAQVEKYRKKFLKEARTLAGLSHPNIIGVIDVFEENGTVYFSMPFLPGGSIKELVNKRGKLSETDAMSYARQVAEALQYMHQECRICHYDVKPDNILLDRKGNAVLIDFGISKNYDAQGNETSTTPVGMSEGYAPIEQYQQMVDDFSPASDVYALGATLYFMITGVRPPTAVSRISGEELDFPASVSSSIHELIERAMTIGMKKRPKEIGLFIEFADSSLTVNKPKITRENKKTFNRSSEETIIASKEQAQPKSEIFTVNGVAFEMVRVEGGTFTMGATNEQGKDASSDEKPAHQVALSDYFIGKYEVTQELWKAVMGSNPSRFSGDTQRPVEQVSWDECQVFVTKLNQLTGLNFRLPTEAEWEYAARGGNQSKRFKYSGSNSLSIVAWFSETSDSKTHAVGSKSPNELGLYDMCGNVWEWCFDVYVDYQDALQNSLPDISTGSLRTLRGGCWSSSSDFCRLSKRFNYAPQTRFYTIGLRLAL